MDLSKMLERIGIYCVARGPFLIFIFKKAKDVKTN